MKKNSTIITLLLCLTLLATGCNRRGCDVVDDTRTASRHVGRGLKVLCGLSDESRAVRSRAEFEGINEYAYDDQFDFVPLKVNENDNLIAMADLYTPQPKHEPGDATGKIPGIEHFRDPNNIPGLSNVFKNIQFPFDSSTIKGDDNIRTLKNISEYLAKNPHLYIFVEGHCDERGPEAYNLALGSKRSNSVRKLLIAEGISPDRIFTISYGKEKPLMYGHDDYSWTQNRRVEFKVFQHH